MKTTIILTIILCLLNNVLLVNQDLGINVILFTIPLLITIIYLLKEYDLIKNKKGLLFLIPIVILSLSFFIYDNSLKYLNMLVIPILYLLMYITTIKPVNTIFRLFVETLNIVIKPLDKISEFLKKTINILFKGKSINEHTKKVIKSTIIVLPIVFIVMLLLISADSIFGNIFNNIVIFKDLSIDGFIHRVIMFFLLFIYLLHRLH